MDAAVVMRAFDAIGGDPDAALRAAKNYSSLGTWKAAQAAQTGAAGAASAAVPLLHLPAIAADVAFLLHKMAFCSWGVGGMVGAPVDGKDDFLLILGVWSGDLKETELDAAIITGTVAGMLAFAALQPTMAAQFAGKAAGMAAGTVFSAAGTELATKLGAKGSAKALGKAAGKAGAKVSSKLAEKLVLKIGPKLAAKGVGGFVPLLGPMISGGVNAYFTKDIADSAETYYRRKDGLFR